jgi:hypothetical protein
MAKILTIPVVVLVIAAGVAMLAAMKWWADLLDGSARGRYRV